MAKVTGKPTVRFSQKAYQQMRQLTKECDIEISAMGIIATDAQKEEWGIGEDFYVLEYFVIDQECTSVSTDLCDDAFIELVMSLRERGIKSEQIVVWWHSHVNMGVEHSGTDEAQIERFDFDTVCISPITNKSGALNVRIDLYKPIRHTFLKCDFVVDEINVLPENWAKEQIEEHVTKKTVRPQKINVVKAPKTKVGKQTHSWNSNSRWRSDYSYYGNFGYEELDVADEPETTEPIEDVGYAADLDSIELPEELSQVKKAWDLRLLDTQEMLDLYAKFYAKELSAEETIEALTTEYGISKDELSEDIEEDDDIISEAFGGYLTTEAKALGGSK